MANEQNLRPGEYKFTLEEAKKGAQKSAEVRRKRKAMKEQAEMIMSLPFTLADKNSKTLKKTLNELGVNEDDIDNQLAMLIALWKTTLKDGKNQISAIKEFRDIIGDKTEKEAKIQRVEIINDLPQEKKE